jgi:RNA polymerase sigma-70 factor (ECF subfamily)
VVIPDDTELAIRLREGDVDAFNSLYYKYYNAVFSNVFNLTKNEESARDILQEVFISLWERRQYIDLEKPVANWLFVVSYNKALNCLKKVMRHPTILLIPEIAIPDEETSSRVREAQSALVKEAVGHLSPQTRRVFELCKLQGKSYEETAQELDLSRHTVKEYLSVAMNFIKAYVRKYPDFSALAGMITLAELASR